MDFICSMVAFSYSNWSGKVRFVFNMFDFDGSGGITLDEMTILGGSFARGICFATQQPAPKVSLIGPLITQIFQEADTCPDNIVTIEELMRWVAH
jgi:hypothetical protein